MGNKHKKSRNVHDTKGMSLIEMLTAMMLTGFIAAATCDMMAALGLVSLKADNQLTSTIQCKRALDLIGQQVRSAHSLKLDSSSSSQKLTLQIPVIGNSSMGSLDSVPLKTGTAPENYDVYEYSVVPDASRQGSGEYILQRILKTKGARGSLAPDLGTAVLQPQIIAKGIIGPLDMKTSLDGTANNYYPKIFSYLLCPKAATTPSYPYPELPDSSGEIPVSGVAVQMEVQSAQVPNSKIQNSTFCIRSEFYCKSDCYAP